MILAVGGELDTAFVLPGIYSDDNPAPSASADARHVEFPDGAVMSYEPETGALTVTGIKTADVTASDSVAVSVPVVLVKPRPASPLIRRRWSVPTSSRPARWR